MNLWLALYAKMVRQPIIHSPMHTSRSLGGDGIIGYGDVNDPVIGDHNNWNVLGSKEA